MNSAQTFPKKAQDELDALALYNLYNSNKSNREDQNATLKSLKAKRKFRPIWSAMCSLQHNQIATSLIENDIHSHIGQKNIKIKGKSYVVTLYFLPVTLSTSPDIESTESLNPETGGVNSIEVMAALPNQTCNDIAETIKKHINLKDEEKISILSGLIDRNLLTEYAGLEFISGLTNRLADYAKDQSKDEAIVKWLAKFDAMQSVYLSPLQPEDHRALVLYTLTEEKNDTVGEKLKSLNCLVNNYHGSFVQRSDYALGSEIHEIITNTYRNAISRYNGSVSIVCSTLPPQTYAFLRLSYFSNTLVNMVNISKGLWGGVSECKIDCSSVSEYLTKIDVSIQTADGGGVFSMSQIYEPSYRYNPDDEISCHADMVKHIAQVNTTFTIS
ncbi:hypothetical protein QX249_09505 [Vibrio parahaemolyticus]|uniref:Uncharacterized protein n=1 Tax=Vibrio parahaemolyticus TaxID=670 RepID=A0AAW8PXY9_VIBPH|nr:hypothetical protein [Vibrio parahaemolyticus]EGR2229494.1 hypothetical protein [Vibrio parahaemolyticus]MDS1820891.1 hypothetical protein [Vibrio parahaemolyticus]